VRRKYGGDVAVWRPVTSQTTRLTTEDGGESTPCVLCRAALLTFGMRVHCRAAGDAFHGHLDERGAPVCRPTSAQRRLFARGRG
jgi:hypothetical protein